jgi:hypothetical protein
MFKKETILQATSYFATKFKEQNYQRNVKLYKSEQMIVLICLKITVKPKALIQ